MKRVVLVVMLVVIAAFVAGWKWKAPNTQSGKAALPAVAGSHVPGATTYGWSWGGGGDE
jgi:hypothetical protein